jgi:hypothetical protein
MYAFESGIVLPPISVKSHFVPAGSGFCPKTTMAANNTDKDAIEKRSAGLFIFFMISIPPKFQRWPDGARLHPTERTKGEFLADRLARVCIMYITLPQKAANADGPRCILSEYVHLYTE